MTESIIAQEIADMKPEALAIDGADANAIEEVNIAYDNVKEVDGLDISKEGSEAWEAAMKRYNRIYFKQIFINLSHGRLYR